MYRLGYLYTGETNKLCGSRGVRRDETIYQRETTWGMFKQSQGNHEHRLESHTDPKHLIQLRVISADRLEIRIAREQEYECRELMNQSGIEQRRWSYRTAQKQKIINMFSIT